MNLIYSNWTYRLRFKWKTSWFSTYFWFTEINMYKDVLANIMFGLTVCIFQLNWMQMFVGYCVFLSCILSNANQTKSSTAPSATIILLPKGFICMCTVIHIYNKISIAKCPHTMLYWFVPLQEECVFNSFLTHCTKYRSQISYALKIPVAVLLASIVFTYMPVCFPQT